MALRDAIGKVVLKLPERVLARMAGEPLVIDGRTLDVRLQLAAAAAADAPPMRTLDPATARAAAADGFARTNAPRAPGVAVHERSIGTHGVTVRVYHPPSADGARPGVLFFHQGGWVIGDLDTCDTFCSDVAAGVGAVVVSVGYRLAPEHRFPAQLDDAVEAWSWLLDHAEGLGIDAGRLVVCGDSAGGQLATALCAHLRDGEGRRPAAQVLVYPVVDATAADGSMVSCAETFPLSADTMEWFYEQALPDGFDRADPRLSPALAPNLAGLPPAVVVTAGFDPLRDQGMAYALALRSAGVEVIDRCEDALSHSFLAMGGLTPAARAASRRIVDDISRLPS